MMLVSSTTALFTVCACIGLVFLLDRLFSRERSGEAMRPSVADQNTPVPPAYERAHYTAEQEKVNLEMPKMTTV